MHSATAAEINTVWYLQRDRPRGGVVVVVATVVVDIVTFADDTEHKATDIYYTAPEPFVVL